MDRWEYVWGTETNEGSSIDISLDRSEKTVDIEIISVGHVAAIYLDVEKAAKLAYKINEAVGIVRGID